MDLNLLRELDPITREAERTWVATQRDRLGRSVQSRLDEVDVETQLPANRPRRLLVGVLGGLLMACVLLAGLAARHSENRTADANPTQLLQIELSSGSIWVSSPAASSTAAATEFAHLAFNWGAPTVTAQPGETNGPTWIAVRRGATTVGMLFVPDDPNAVRWRLLQLGTDPNLGRGAGPRGTTRVSFTVPHGATHGLLASRGTRTSRTSLSAGDLARGYADLVDASGPVVVVFLDHNGSVIAATGIQ